MTPKVALIGGRGLMGRWFKRFFESQGLTVLVADKDTPKSPQEVARLADVVMLSVPIPQVALVAQQVGPHLKPQAALMDLTSIKAEPVAAMMAHFPGEVVGTHPLFGPGTKSIKGHTVVLTPGRGERWLNWLKDLLLKAGAQVKITTPEEHDRLMALVQGLAHFVLIALGATFRHVGADLHELEDFATPTFRTILDLTRHHLSQDAILYACIQLQNQANLTVLSSFEEVVQRLVHLIHHQDAVGLIRLLEEARGWICGGGGQGP